MAGRGRGLGRGRGEPAAAASASPSVAAGGAGRGAASASRGQTGLPTAAQQPQQQPPAGVAASVWGKGPPQSAWAANAPAQATAWGPPLGASGRGGAKAPTAAPVLAPVTSAVAAPVPSGRGQTGIRPGMASAAPPAGQGRAMAMRTGAGDPAAPSAAAVTAPSVAADAAAAGPTVARSDIAARGTSRGTRVLAEILTTRPEALATKRGTKGAPVTLTANYFRLEKSTTWNLYQYRVDFSPNIEIAGLRNRLIFEQKAQLGGYVFDGTVLFTSKRLPNDVCEFMSKDREDNPIQITVKFVGLVSMSTAASVQVLNLIMRRAMGGLKLQLVGRNLFDALAKVDVREHRLQLWPGYVTSIRQHESDLLLCAEMSCKVMRTETLYDIMQEVLRESRNFKQEFLNKVLGMTVLTDYNNKTYRIDDVDFTQSPSDTFPTKQGDITFVQYYKDKYHITIKDVKQPLLLSKVRAKDVRGGRTAAGAAGADAAAPQNELLALVPELCRATGMSDRMRANFHLMAAISQYTRLAPGDRINKLMAFNKRLRTTPESADVMREWNLQLSEQMTQLNGRRLPSEAIVFGNGGKTQANAQADWSREFHEKPMFSSVMLQNWACICPRMCEQETRAFTDCLQKAAAGMKYTVGRPNLLVVPDDRMLTIQRAIDDAMNGDPQLIMVVVPNNNADKYAAIKKKCCVERPVATQVMVSRTIKMKPGKERNLLSVATKVLIQINCKLGGAAWMTVMPCNGIMTIGFDVCHDNRDRNKSYGAMVATMDLKQCSKYFSAVSAHTNGEELSNEFSVNVTKALKEYRNEHHALPDRILIYRDGVGEGQTDYVYEHEVVVLRRKLDEIYKSANVEKGYRMAFIIVSKRINTRFFLNGANPMPGTVVDDVVTLPERYDFFLVSQSCRVGTASPTSYNVISDNAGLSPSQLQEFSYKMTHLYYNWTGTLRVPAVCQYAHKLAFLVGQFIHQSPSNLLEKQLYFI